MLTESMLRCFIAVAETLNFTKAAEGLFLTQQAVSRNISALEKELNFKLMDRDTHSVKLTPCGEIYYRQMRRLVTEYYEIIGEIRNQFSENKKVLNLGIVDSPDFYKFQGALHDYQKTQPDGFSLNVVLGPPDKLAESIKNDELDALLVIDCFIQDKDTFEIVSLGETKMNLCVSKTNKLYKKGANWKRYAKEPLIMQVEAGRSAYVSDGDMNFIMKEFNLQPSAIILMSEIDKLATLVEEGRGIMLCLEKNPNFNNDVMTYVPIEDHIVNYAMVWKKANTNGNIVLAKKFTKYLSQHK